jgi:hypothetical protein
MDLIDINNSTTDSVEAKLFSKLLRMSFWDVLNISTFPSINIIEEFIKSYLHDDLMHSHGFSLTYNPHTKEVIKIPLSGKVLNHFCAENSIKTMAREYDKQDRMYYRFMNKVIYNYNHIYASKVQKGVK